MLLHLWMQRSHIGLREELRSRGGAPHDGLPVIADQRHAPVPHGALGIPLDRSSPVVWILLLVPRRPPERVRLVVRHHRRLDNRDEREVHVRLRPGLVQMHVGAHDSPIAHPVAQKPVCRPEELPNAALESFGHRHDQIGQRLCLGTYLQALAQLSVSAKAPAIMLGREVVDGQVPVDVVALAYRALVVGEHPARVPIRVSSQMHRRRHLSKQCLSSRLVRLASYTLPRVYHSGILRPFAAALSVSARHMDAALGTARPAACMDGLRPSKPPLRVRVRGSAPLCEGVAESPSQAHPRISLT